MFHVCVSALEFRRNYYLCIDGRARSLGEILYTHAGLMKRTRVGTVFLPVFRVYYYRFCSFWRIVENIL